MAANGASCVRRFKGMVIGLCLSIVATGTALAVSASPGSSSSQAVRLQPINTVSVRSHDVDDGLPQNTVHAIAQSADGYLWVATFEGVARFNGQRFEAYEASSEALMAPGGARSLLATDDGSLWVGQSQNGVIRHHEGQWLVVPENRMLGNTQVLALLRDRKQRLLVGTADHGVVVVGESGTETVEEAGQRVLGMALAPDGRLLIATHRGLQRIDMDSGARETFGGGQTRSVLVTREGRILVGGDTGLHELDEDGLRAITLPLPLQSASITAMVEDTRQRLWFGTQTNGLFRARFDDRGDVRMVESLGTDEGLPDLRVLSLMFDREGTLWVGSNGGLTQVIETAIERFGPAQGLDQPFARATLQLPDGDVVIGTSGGLYRYRDGVLVQQWGAEHLGSRSVTALALGPDGDLWVGTYDGGVSRLRGGEVIDHVDREDGLPQLSIRALLFTRDGTLWIGTSEGLARYADDTASVVDLYPKDTPDFVLSLAETPSGTLWIGTAIGLASLDSAGKVSIHNQSNGYPALDTFDIQLSDDRNGWLATDAGLLRMQDGRFRAIGRAQGMPSDTLFRLLMDHGGAFWVTSNRGLARVDAASIQDVLDGRQERVDTQLITEESGLTATQCNGGTQPAGMLATDGSLWVPTAKGVSKIHPGDFPPRPKPPPPLALESVLVDGVAAEPPLHLAPAARRIEFQFAGLAFASPGSLRYRHWLEGYDADYGPPTRETRIGYTNLPPGEFTLHSLAILGDNGQPGPSLSVPFSVEATLLQTPWFQALLVLLGAAMVYLVYRSRISAIRRNERRLEAMVDSRTAELQDRAIALSEANREKNQLLEQLSHQARHDSLTGLPNRSRADHYLDEVFEAARDGDAPLVVALLDVDHFKHINDRHSHQAGDRVLVWLADHMRRFPGLWSARIGGEEFLLLCQQEATAAARQLERLRAAVAAVPAPASESDSIRVTVSIGWTEAKDHASPAKAVAEADRRLYRAKSEGRDRVVPASNGAG
ncbi:MAG: two-component regulator propeller domain-containing protein [Lysobacteraceae bacterium]